RQRAVRREHGIFHIEQFPQPRDELLRFRPLGDPVARETVFHREKFLAVDKRGELGNGHGEGPRPTAPAPARRDVSQTTAARTDSAPARVAPIPGPGRGGPPANVPPPPTRTRACDSDATPGAIPRAAWPARDTSPQTPH